MLNNRRYIRCSYCYDAAVSSDDEQWKEVTVENISAGGLNFFTKTAKFMADDILYFKLEIGCQQSGFTSYESKAKGRIVRMVPSPDERFEYGVEFIEKDMPSLTEIINYIMA